MEKNNKRFLFLIIAVTVVIIPFFSRMLYIKSNF